MNRYVVYKCAVHKLKNVWFSLYKYVSYDGQCIVMSVLQLFRLNIACVKKLFLCLASLTRSQQFKERLAVCVGSKVIFLAVSSLWRCKHL